MNKNLENEYRELINSEIPDLWARIETGLVPKKRKISFPRFGTFAAAAAACVCLAAAVPVIMMSRNFNLGSSNFSGGSSGAPDSISSNASTGAAADTASPAYDMADGAAAAVENNFSYGGEQMSGGDDYSESVSDSAEEAITDNGKSAIGDERSYETEISNTANIVAYVEILSVMAEDDIIVYLARIDKSDRDDLMTGAEVKIYGSDEGGELLEEGGLYKLHLIQAEDDEGMPVFYYNQNG